MTAQPSGVPYQIGPYPVVRKLGQGSFGEVFLAKQPSVGRFVAIKRARAPKGSDHDGSAFLAMFLSETEVSAKLVHANIVSVIDAGQDADGSPYIVMEYVQARSRSHGPAPADVAALLQKWRCFEPLDAAYICAGVAQALAHAHHEGVIHRDVKPSNILISGLGDIKLTDFGIAKIQRAGQYAPTSTEHFAGSPPYMAPELHDDRSDRIQLDHRVDLWALGVVGWELVCGFRPFEDEALEPRPAHLLAEQWVKINARKGRRRSIHDVAPHVPEAFRNLIEECLQPLEKRMATADEFFTRLIDAKPQALGLPTYRKTFVRLFVNDTVPASDQMDGDDDPQHATGEIEAAAVLVPSARSSSPAALAPSPPMPSAAPASVRAALGLLGPGDRFGNFDIVRKLGAGGMAIVYEATRTITLGGTQRVALKVIRPEHSANPEFLERFAIEAKIAVGMNHQAIVRVLDAGDVEGVHFIAMDFVEGCDLDSLLRQYGRFPWAVVAVVAYEIATALRYAHARGIVHRDISPHNALVNVDAAVLLADWGVAKPVSANGMVSRTSTAVGKPYYMPPEQLAGHPLDGRADLFAMGVTMFELLTGITPYAARATKNEHLAMLVQRIFANDRPHVFELAPADTPPALAEIIEDLLQPNLESPTIKQRMRSADELIDRLMPLVQIQARHQFAELVRRRDATPEQRAQMVQAISGTAPVTMGSASDARSHGRPLPGASGSPLPSTPEARASDRSRALLIALAAALLVLVGLSVIGAVMLWPATPDTAANIDSSANIDRSAAPPTQVAAQEDHSQPVPSAHVEPPAPEQSPEQPRPTAAENTGVTEPQMVVEHATAPAPETMPATTQRPATPQTRSATVQHRPRPMPTVAPLQPSVPSARSGGGGHAGQGGLGL